ncbi:MAG TPA: DsbE family thiol:disulfide interchange protein [Rhizomicrobium sp.]|jgi:cytochrome c biogenesis protein CcmG/thiol:disulfide interchange protein DsbE|nr:DsbE family thiol:disulfide interchange protein [Rhizomicrobium sp.]
MKRLLYVLPILAFAGLVYLFFHSLNGPPPDELPSALIDRPAPATNLPPLDSAATAFNSADLRAGHVTVLNVWASWCVPCRAEAPALAALSQLRGVALYGMVYEDRAAAARAFLNEAGNPFSRVDLDRDGRAGIEWGIYGVPETFVIDGKGIVRLRYAGPIVGDVMDTVILPAIARARTTS